MLGQVFASRLLTTQQQSSARRLMDSFSDIAAGTNKYEIPSLMGLEYIIIRS